MHARQYLTAVFSVALVFGASRDLRTQRAPDPRPAAPQAATAPSAATLNKYCATCHNEKVRAGGFTLEKLNAEDPGADAAAWEKVVRKLRTGAMPPAGRPRPDAATYDAVASHFEAKLDAAARINPEPGRLPLFHRLTRTEYKNAIRDLLGLEDLSKDVDLDLLLPADNSSSGFDNIADLLFVSSTQLEQYLSAAQKLSAVAVGDQSLPPLVDVYRMSEQFNQEYQAEGAPFGTRGGTVIRTYLPLDGDYRIHIELADAPREPHQLEVVVDDERVRRDFCRAAESACCSGSGDRDEGCGAGRCGDRRREVGRDRDGDQDQLCRQPPLRARSAERGPQEGAREGFRSRCAHEGGPARHSRDVPQAHVRERRSAHSTAAAREGATAGDCERHHSWSADDIGTGGNTEPPQDIHLHRLRKRAVRRRFSRRSRVARTAGRSARPTCSRCSRYMRPNAVKADSKPESNRVSSASW